MFCNRLNNAAMLSSERIFCVCLALRLRKQTASLKSVAQFALPHLAGPTRATAEGNVFRFVAGL